MEISKQLIESFLNHQCSPQEADFVSNYLQENPEQADLFIPKKDWDETSTYSLADDSFWKNQWKAIAPAQRNKVIVFMKRWAVAAVLLITAGSGYFYFSQAYKSKNVAQRNLENTQTVMNHTGFAMFQTLKDGSMVELEPGAEIVFNENFGQEKRDIELKGEAVFTVAKNKLIPFVVKSGNITTTAVGTKFKVAYGGTDKETKVYLYEGKVVVKSILPSNTKEAYLLPGDELSYLNNVFEVQKNRNNSNTANLLNESKTNRHNNSTGLGINSNKNPPDKKGKDKLNSNNGIAIPQWYKFEKESLAGVFDDLSDLYGVTISYKRADLKSKYFIGKFEQTNSIDKILNTIANLNQLKIEKLDSVHYRVSK